MAIQVASAQTEGDILYNVVRVDIEEIDEATGNVKEGGETYTIKCDSEISIEAVINEGNKVTLRDSKKILARAEDEDLVEGYNLTLTTVKFPIAVIPIIQGGTLKKSTESGQTGKIIGYSAPTMAEGVTNKKYFRLTAYSENRLEDAIVNYAKVTFWRCKGKPVNLNLKKDFFAPQFDVKCTENAKINKSPYDIDYVAALPVS